MADDTSILDSLTPIAPTDGMVASGLAKGAKAQPSAIPTMHVRPDEAQSTSVLDSLAPIKPTDSMLMAVGKQPGTEGQGAGILANAAAGANKQIFGALGAPVDFATGAMNLIPRGINAATGSQIPTIDNPVGGSQWLGQQFGKVSVDPNTVQPTNEAERVAQGVGGGVAAVPTLALGGAAAAARGMSGLPGSVANAIRSSGGTTAGGAALTAGAAGVGGGVGQAASDAAPEWAKPYADLAGNLAGAGAVAGAARGAQNAGNLIVRKAGEVGIGSKMDLNGIRATQSQANAVGNKVSSAIGPEGQQTIERSLDTENQAQSLEKQLADPNLHPDDRSAAQQQLQDIQGRRVNLVPDSKPTTAQVAQTPGATDLESALRVQNGAPFSERAQQQNNARVGAIQGLEPNQGEPASVGRLFTQKLDELEAQGQARISQQTANVQGLTEASGGQAPPAQYGGQMREMLTGAEAPEHSAASALFKAVDPEGKWTIQSAPLKTIGQQLGSEVSPTAQTDSQVNALMARAQSLPPVIKFSDLSQMRADANDGLSRLMRSGAAPSETRRLTILKQGIDQTISQSIDDQVKVDPSLAERFNGVSGGSQTNPNSGTLPPESSSGRPPVSNQGMGGGGQSQAGFANAEGALTLAHPGGTGTPTLTPNVGTDEASSYYRAVQAWKDLKEKFGQGGVGAVLKQNDQGFKVPEGNVPSKIFTAGPTEPAEVQRFITAVGGADKASDIGRNVLANDLRNKGIIKPEGTVDASKLAAWHRNRGPTLAQFPGLDSHFASVEAAQGTLDEVTAAHKDALKEFNSSAAAKFIHADPSVAVRSALSSQNPTETFTQLVQAVRGTPAAEDGLKRAVVDHIIQQHSSAVPSSDGMDMMKAAQFRSWVAKNKGPLRVLFGPPKGQLPSGIQTLEMVAADLRRQAEGPKAVAGSQSTPHQARAVRLGMAALGHGIPTTLLTIVGEHLGEHMGHGMAGMVALPALGMAAHALRQAGIRTIENLKAEAMLHPELARTLMQRADASKAISTMTQRHIAAALQGAIMADMTEEKRQ